MYTEGRVPTHCAKCHSRKWNAGGSEKKNSDGAPRFAPPGDRPLVGTAAGLAVCVHCGQLEAAHVGKNRNCNNSLDPLFVFTPRGGRVGVHGKPQDSQPFRMPEWSEERLKELADAEPSGLMACSPELLAEFKEIAKTDPAVAAVLERAGVQVGSGGGMVDAAAASKRQGVAAPDTRPSAASPDGEPAGSNPAPSPSDRQKILDDLAWGEMQDGLYNNGANVGEPGPEVEICGHREHIWETGEWVMCTLPKNHRKGRHGNPVKVEGPE